MLSRLPKKHLRIGAVVFFGFGLSLATMTFLDAEWALRSSPKKPYALVELIDWLVDVLGRVTTCIIIVVVFSIASLFLLNLSRKAD